MDDEGWEEAEAEAGDDDDDDDEAAWDDAKRTRRGDGRTGPRMLGMRDGIEDTPRTGFAGSGERSCERTVGASAATARAAALIDTADDAPR